MKKTISLLLIFISVLAYSQENDDFSQRLKAINTQSVTYYNVDGVDFSSQTYNYDFSEKSLKKIYKKFNIKDTDLKTKDESLPFNNLHVVKKQNITDNLTQNNSYYFIEDNSKTITIIWFGYYHKPSEDFEKEYITRIINNTIPKNVFESMKIDSIDFAGRKIKLGNNCYWTNVNTVQCPYNGEMNWSVHKNIESAKTAIENQFIITKNRGGIKVISEEQTAVIFEGTETTAKKVVFDFTGMKSLLAGMSGGKTLTVYYVAEKVRDNYVSCVMSFWNNDNITKDGLAPLLEEVMQLKI
ncbi:hypothetical protein SAMN06265349_102114 [Flavobacterium resistens]|uniref:Uncharacterized protein n=1 Tax=Flavobacterium resistens TaxID=443612 RepID=A0A521C1U7_9FLAO|nr:hypothetical protein [Flavobacterium resistens]MRX69664.1 hypothetical protein [Flavobacterium resistens]SMO53354.1 hypothetical protein SAMN06265349_102114 [Flavobacterium resistens]